jgi:HJR/Mrr/RecB family endonuclease
VVVAPDFLTFDAKLDKLLDRKRALSTDMLNGSGDVSPADFGDLEAPDGGNAFGEDPLTSEDIPSLGPDAFEAFCALLWSKQGFTKTIKTARVGDGGVDIVAIHGAKGELIQCKSSGSEGRELGWEAIKDVAAGSPAYAARYPNVRFNLVAATNRRFNQAAREQAQTLHVRLVDGDELARMLEATPTKRGELNRFLMSGWRST